MGRLKDLDVIGVTDLQSYVQGVEDTVERITKLIETVEQQYLKASPTSPICLYPFRELLQILEKNSAVNKSTNA
jgi:hypothetical protein